MERLLYIVLIFIGLCSCLDGKQEQGQGLDANGNDPNHPEWYDTIIMENGDTLFNPNVPIDTIM
jgi:arginine exporter protein ArgO